jgi:hypothetical protein
VARQRASNQATPASAQPTNRHPSDEAGEKNPNLDNCFKVLVGVQEQIRFADTKAAFLFAVNTLMFGFVANGVGVLKKGLTIDPVPPSAWVGLGALVVFGACFGVAVGTLIYAVMSRFGEKAPRCHIFFGHIASQYGHDFEKYVMELRAMSEDDWFKELGTQIVETSHIALTKHKAVRTAAQIAIVGFLFWGVAVFSISLIT